MSDTKYCWECCRHVPYILENGKKGWYNKSNRCRDCKQAYNKTKDDMKQYMPLWARTDSIILNTIKLMTDEVTRLNNDLKEKGLSGKYTLDHIIPRNGRRNGVKGKYVTGLHMPDNLRIILEGPNVKKGNVFSSKDEDVENERLLKIANDSRYINMHKQ